MSPVGRLGRLFGSPSLFCSLSAVLIVVATGSVSADPLDSQPSSPVTERQDGRPTMDELREHASIITEILDTASERVERLAAADVGTPALVEAIRQELSLTRRWNRHLSTILQDVAEARRALGEREREAAKEVTRITAVAEEARRELLALKKVLKGSTEDRAQQSSDQRSQLMEGHSLAGVDDQAMSKWPKVDITLDDIAGSEGDLQAMRMTLASVQDAQKSAVRDVDAIRGKIIEILETLAAQHGFLPADTLDDDSAELSSEDITAWAASMATRLERKARDEQE